MPKCIPAPNADDHGQDPAYHTYMQICRRTQIQVHNPFTHLHSHHDAYKHQHGLQATHALHVHTTHVRVHTCAPACLIPALRTHVFICTLYPSPMLSAHLTSLDPLTSAHRHPPPKVQPLTKHSAAYPVVCHQLPASEQISGHMAGTGWA